MAGPSLGAKFQPTIAAATGVVPVSPRPLPVMAPAVHSSVKPVAQVVATVGSVILAVFVSLMGPCVGDEVRDPVQTAAPPP